MQLFSPDPNRHYAMSIFSIFAIPCAQSGTESVRQLCSDACHLCGGSGALSAELLRIAGSSPGSQIRHLLILRATDSSKARCRSLALAFSRCAQELLHRQGYLLRAMPFRDYLALCPGSGRQTVWALVKDEIQEGDALSPGLHISLPVLGKIDLAPVYAALDGSGCTLSIQMTAQRFSPPELAAIHRFYACCSRAADGSLLPIRDGLANFSRERWRYYVDQAQAPAAITNVIITGAPHKAACVIARLKSAMTDLHSQNSACLRAVPLSDIPSPDPSRLPWEYEQILRSKIRSKTGPLARKLSAEEVGALMALPCGTKSFTGLKRNPFSLLRRDIPVPKINPLSPAHIPLGMTHCGAPLCLPLSDLPLHTGIFGKSGFGKTMLQLNILDELAARGISTLVLEPVKREYRTCSRSCHAKVFTVEDPAVPLFVNPFLPPSHLTLREYKPHLLKAFQAAFTMPDPLPSLFARAVTDCYALYNWRDSSRPGDRDVTHFGLSEFVRVFQNLLEHSRYAADVRGNMLSGGTFRLNSLLDRCRLTFETVESVPIEQLLKGQTVLELGRLQGEEKCLVAALTLISALACLHAARDSGAPLQNVLLLDEAHVLLDSHSSTDEGTAANETMACLIANIQAEMRALGVGLIIADQSPSRIGSRLLDNCDTRILFRLTGTEGELAARALGLTQEEHLAVSILGVGEALISNHTLNGVVGLYTTPRAPAAPVSDKELRALMAAHPDISQTHLRPFLHCSLCSSCQQGCRLNIREKAAMLSCQIYYDRRSHITDRDALVQHLLSLPDVLCHSGEDHALLCRCTAIQLYRRAVSHDPALGLSHELPAVFSRLDELIAAKEARSP